MEQHTAILQNIAENYEDIAFTTWEIKLKKPMVLSILSERSGTGILCMFGRNISFFQNRQSAL